LKYALALLFALVSASASADNCEKRFIGDWMVHVVGQTYVGHLLPGGIGTADCPGCASGTWTCSGNRITKTVNGRTYYGTLSADGNTLVEDYGVATRIGSGPARQEAPKKKDQCVTPPPAVSEPSPGGRECLVLSNTANTNSKCQFNCRYQTSMSPPAKCGINVHAGEVNRDLCGRPGEKMHFLGWIPVPANAQ
jgi:hypothetical protein